MQKLAFVLLLVSASVFSQEQKLVAEKTGHFYFRADAYAGHDNFGFQYFIKDNAFVKTNGKDKLEFQKLAYGKLTRADVSNPLLIVLFYENFNAVVLLDNQLNEVKSLNFNELQIPVVARAVGLAAQNRLWVYDGLTQQIGLYDYLKNSYQVLSTPLRESIHYYQTDFNHFQWVDSKSVWHACDLFGKITDLGKLPRHDLVYFSPNAYFAYSDDGKLYIKNLKNNMLYSISGIDNSYKKFYAEAQNLSIFTSSGITNYKITIP